MGLRSPVSLNRVKVERLPGATVPAGGPVLQNLADRIVNYWQADLKKPETHELLQDKYKSLLLY